jgi:radical SAM enzyme (TIGR01210 family)
MCDLWQNTLTEKLPPGAIPEQIDHALASLPAARQIKLYNSGSYFDPQAIPVEDDEAVAARVGRFERVIVESHPALVGARCLRLRDLVQPARLEVAMGLETVHPVAGPRLNKRMTLDGFARAADFLRGHGVALRVFILVKPPFLDEAEGLEWALRSLDFAFDCGASVAALIPTRSGHPGHGALAALGEQGLFSPPALATLEAALASGIEKRRGRVFADLWDLERFSNCPHCFAARAERLRVMNLTQTVPPLPSCDRCGLSI